MFTGDWPPIVETVLLGPPFFYGQMTEDPSCPQLLISLPTVETLLLGHIFGLPGVGSRRFR
jgi:hypothetical protein